MICHVDENIRGYVYWRASNSWGINELSGILIENVAIVNFFFFFAY